MDDEVCPCCGRIMKVYKRKITSSMAYALALIYNYNKIKDEYFHVEDYFKSLNIPSSIRGDFPKLRYWGLICKDNLPRKDGNPNSGFYKITSRGKAFIEKDLAINKYAFIFNNNLLRFSEELITFKECLKDKFCYEELING